MADKVNKPFYKNKGVIAGIIAAIVVIIALVAFFSIKSATNPNRSYDKQFMSALENGLQNRWKISDKDSSDTKSSYQKGIDAELEAVSEFKDKKFKSTSLQEQAIAYINVLNESKKTLTYFGSDKWNTDWDETYDKRTSILVKINKISKIEVSKKNQSTLDELLGSGRAATEKSNFNTKLDNLLDKVSFTAEPKESPSDYTTYKTTVKNTTGKDITSLSASVKLKDENGVVVDNQYINVDQWLNGESTQFDFMTDKQFAKSEIRVSYVDFK